MRVYYSNFFRRKYDRLSSISFLAENYLRNRDDLYIDKI